VVIWSEPAKTDLRSIHNFIARDSHYYAKKVAQDIREKTDILENLPRAGKKVIELSDENIREIPLYSYRVIYEIKNQVVFVLAVLHKRRNLTADEISRDH